MCFDSELNIVSLIKINDKGKLSQVICKKVFSDPLKSVMSSLDLFHIILFCF